MEVVVVKCVCGMRDGTHECIGIKVCSVQKLTEELLKRSDKWDRMYDCGTIVYNGFDAEGNVKLGEQLVKDLLEDMQRVEIYIDEEEYWVVVPNALPPEQLQ